MSLVGPRSLDWRVRPSSQSSHERREELESVLGCGNTQKDSAIREQPHSSLQMAGRYEAIGKAIADPHKGLCLPL